MSSRFASSTARSTVPAPAAPIAPWCLPPAMRNQTTGRPSMSRISADAARVGLARESASVGPVVGHDPGAKTRVALCPPKPNEFDERGPGERARRAGDDVEPRCRRRGVRGSRWAGSPRSASSSSDATASVAPGRTDEVTGDALRRRERAAHCRRTPCESPRLRPRRSAGSRCRARSRDRSQPASSPASSSASCMHAAAPSPPGDGAVMWYASALRP